MKSKPIRAASLVVYVVVLGGVALIAVAVVRVVLVAGMPSPKDSGSGLSRAMTFSSGSKP